jgi:hypothetical protein
MIRPFGRLTGGTAIVGLLAAASVHGSQIPPVAETSYLTVNVPIAARRCRSPAPTPRPRGRPERARGRAAADSCVVSVAQSTGHRFVYPTPSPQLPETANS